MVYLAQLKLIAVVSMDSIPQKPLCTLGLRFSSCCTQTMQTSTERVPCRFERTSLAVMASFASLDGGEEHKKCHLGIPTPISVFMDIGFRLNDQPVGSSPPQSFPVGGRERWFVWHGILFEGPNPTGSRPSDLIGLYKQHMKPQPPNTRMAREFYLY